MQIAVIGSGMVGALIATELSKEYQITVFDNSKISLANLENNNQNIKLKIVDVNDTLFEKEIKHYQLAINCLPGFMGYKILKKLITLGISCTDISFMPEDCLKLSDLALKSNCIIIPDAVFSSAASGSTRTLSASGLKFTFAIFYMYLKLFNYLIMHFLCQNKIFVILSKKFF